MASQLGYSTHGSGRIQAIVDEESEKNVTVGVLILRKMHEWQHTNYFAGMTEKCSKMNVSLVLHYVGEDNGHLILHNEHQPPALRDGTMAGLILVNHWPEEVVARLNAQVACVSIQHSYRSTRLDVIGVDESQGIEQLAEYLYAKGHRNIGFFGNCGQVCNARTRFAAYVSALNQLGLNTDFSNVIDVLPAHLEDKEIVLLPGQIESVIRRIESGVRAWICASDWVGYLLCRGLIDRGYSIPRDVSIVGFDNSEDNTLGCPKLTSITVPALRIGAEALRRLLNRIKHPTSPPLKVLLPCKLFEAQTTSSSSRAVL